MADGSTATADVCVVGAGPAGLLTALAAARAGLRVLVLEGGGPEPASTRQPLPADHVLAPAPYGDIPLDWQRAFGVGGTMNIWAVRVFGGTHGVRLVPFDAVDFAPRSWLPGSDWPITHDEVVPWYQRAHEVMGLTPAHYTPDEFGATDHKAVSLDGFDTGLYHFAEGAALRARLLDALAGTGRVTLEPDALVTKLLPADHGRRVAAVAVRRPDGRREEIPVRRIVLAGGGVENARLLLDDEVDGQRLATPRPPLGAYFTDHPMVRAGVIDLAPGAVASDLGMYCMRELDGAAVMGHLKLSEATQTEHRLFGTGFILLPRPRGYDPAKMRHLKQLAGRRSHGRLVRDALAGPAALRAADARALLQLRRTGRATIDVGGWTAWPGADTTFRRFELIQQTETPPLARNRVELTGAADRIGRRVARIVWSWDDTEAASAAAAQDLLAAAVHRAGLGTMTPAREDGRPVLLTGTHHHMGTTRMHADPRLGVVDRNARVHGVDNLFVAGSSIFTTGGYQNPQLLITALALRLGQHLAERPTA